MKVDCLEKLKEADARCARLLIPLSLALLWAVENYLVQGAAFRTCPVMEHPHICQAIRFSFDLAFATLLVLACNRLLLMAAIVADLILSLIAMAYCLYFHHALSAYCGVTNGEEALRVVEFAVQLIPIPIWGAFFCALVVKLILARLITRPSAGLRWGWVLLCLVIMGFLYVRLQWTPFCFSYIKRGVTRSVKAVYVYGYVNTWLLDSLFGPDMRELALRAAALQKVSPDRLPAAESWSFGSNVVVVQMESCGWSALDYSVNGQRVMPYLSGLARNSRIFRIEAYHDVGSADMDYATLSGGTPLRLLVTYEVPGLTYPNALPRFMQAHGFHTVSLHAVTGEFYNRRRNYVGMGFDEIWFGEEFRALRANRTHWGIRDADLFRVSAEKLRRAIQPQVHFLITVDSHGPWELVPDAEKVIFPHSRAYQENYFNSMHMLDRDVKEYIGSLPAGTLVILYGDHPSGVNYGDFHSALHGEAQFVPCIVHVCGASLAPPTSAPAAASLPEDLRIHDIINCLRRQVAGRGEPAGSAGQLHSTNSSDSDYAPSASGR